MIYACIPLTFGFVYVVFPWGILPLQSGWKLSCDHALDYASLCENVRTTTTTTTTTTTATTTSVTYK